MKQIALVVLAVVLTSCASAAKRWSQIQPGQTQEEVVEVMGQPESFRTIGDQTSMAWQVDRFTTCSLWLNNEGIVSEKTCTVDDAAKARYQAALMQYLQRSNQQPQQPSYRAPIYQPPRRQQTSCQTSYMGDTASTNCTTNETGIDTSIYNR